MDPKMAEAFRFVPYGIYVLTTLREGKLRAMIVSWVSQVSYHPPLLMVTLRRTRDALPAIRESGAFALSLLRVEQKPLVALFKGPTSRPGFADLFFEAGERGARFLKEALASWECRLSSTTETGDHILCIGEVLTASAAQEGKPLSTTDYGKSYIGQS